MHGVPHYPPVIIMSLPEWTIGMDSKGQRGWGRAGGRFEGWRSVENQLKIAMDDLLLDACATHLQFDCPIGEFGIIAR